MSTNQDLIATADALAREFGLEIQATYWSKAVSACQFSFSGGRSGSPDPRMRDVFCGGNTVAEAAEKFRVERHRLAAIDPLEDLKRQAARHGLELIPAAHPLDLQTLTAAQG